MQGRDGLHEQDLPLTKFGLWYLTFKDEKKASGKKTSRRVSGLVAGEAAEAGRRDKHMENKLLLPQKHACRMIAGWVWGRVSK